MTADLRGQLQAVYDQRGQLTPTDVVEVARDQAHPLHARFEWDDAVAGEQYRRQQAHELIRSVRVRYRDSGDQPKDVRAFQAVRSESGYRYEPVERVVEDDVLTRIVLQDMEREWRDLKARYDRFDEFRRMVAADFAPEVA